MITTTETYGRRGKMDSMGVEGFMTRPGTQPLSEMRCTTAAGCSVDSGSVEVDVYSCVKMKMEMKKKL
jgi:hypothetical protein